MPCPAGQPEPSAPSLQSCPWRQAGVGECVVPEVGRAEMEIRDSVGGSALRVCEELRVDSMFLTGPFQAEILCS